MRQQRAVFAQQLDHRLVHFPHVLPGNGGFARGRRGRQIHAAAIHRIQLRGGVTFDQAVFLADGEVFLTVPSRLKESAYALGATKWEVSWDIVLPYTRSAVIGGVFLGLGRALGETMAVAFVIGNSVSFTASLLEPSTTIAALIANDFGEATETYRAALLLLGFVLFIVTFIVLALARLMLLNLARKEGNR